ncbi:MAG: bifunctional hydroxymethylpyrimidine kinase/phosphomethylpyrimidine kinase [Novosphingobium sp.]
MTSPPRSLSIAGSDSAGGAGIQADIKTITMMGGYAMTAITAVTAQDSTGVHAVVALDPALVAAQIDACLDDIGVDAIKIGMLGSAAIAALVAAKIADRIAQAGVPVVFDPVMVATSGAALADPATVAAFDRLMALATLTTPNVSELAALGGAEALAARGIAFLAKGGDAPGEVVTDRLHIPGQAVQSWSAPRIATRHSHGTGCTLSSAIACQIGRGIPLLAAIERARAFVRAALEAAPGFGSGNGPLGHHAATAAHWRD